MEENEGKSSLGGRGSSSDDDTSESETELMVTSRVRRTTAGNRYSTLVAQEEATPEDAEDEVAMLFAEGEGEDDDFNSDDGDEDADMSSSDDDDQGPNIVGDDMEGEKEIQKEAKAEKARKRKADLAMTTMAGLRKKPKIDPTALRRAPAPKPTKRKERVSWLPGSGAAPGRTSLRKQTILHRAETHAKLKENEVQRLKLKAKREKREREREAEAPKEMTQADRLAEAERVERRNAKSLNRWEAMEKKRAEEQAARLAALKERKLEGAVLTWHSSSAKYIGLKDTKDSEGPPPPEAKKRGRKPKALLEQLAAAKLASSGASIPVLIPNSTITTNQDLTTSNLIARASETGMRTDKEMIASGSSVISLPLHPLQSETLEVVTQPQPASERPKDSEKSFLADIGEYASVKDNDTAMDDSITTSQALLQATSDELSSNVLQGDPSESEPRSVETSNDQATDKDKPSLLSSEEPSTKAQRPHSPSNQGKEEPEPSPPQNNLTRLAHITSDSVVSDAADSTPQESGAETTADHSVNPPLPKSDHDSTAESAELREIEEKTLPTLADTEHKSEATSLAEPPIEVISTRNLVILDRFEDLSEQSRHDFGLFYNSRKSAKPIKPSQELCPITGLTARYRDPATGITYANATAYKKLQELKDHHFAWSSMLGCYVGRANLVARGVPEGFL